MKLTVIRGDTHHHHDIRSDAWGHASGRLILLRTQTKAEKFYSAIFHDIIFS
jgi:hypothetical protein